MNAQTMHLSLYVYDTSSIGKDQGLSHQEKIYVLTTIENSCRSALQYYLNKFNINQIRYSVFVILYLCQFNKSAMINHESDVPYAK